MAIVARIGLVVHWFGFLVGAFFFLLSMGVGFVNTGGWQAFLSAPIFFFIPWGIGWLIRYILVGRIKLLPWEKN